MKSSILKNILCALGALLVLIPSAGAQVVQAGSSVQITIMGVPAEEQAKVTGMYPVTDSGTITLPIVNQVVRAAGLSQEALARSIENVYKSREIYTNPTVQVFPDGESIGVKQQMVHIGGQVRAPGPKGFTKGLTLYQAVQAAGGSTEFGSIKRVKLYRNGKIETYDLNDPKVMLIPLQPDDTIQIPQKNWYGG